ncbi:lysophospholipid acyltransferase family protein [Rhodococcus tibetensis]|uniref:1-acyl-sn-glycerol-3-phosphate acyltransferase n=1 Tax=Rhodococcus tibetensis TaxID=2965064 RepID=A0ABT1QDM3_9NOCA|nr:lysophospholipid acyltransferase family protein [Rhodococcus sp. FXJ9.536]MCQ4120356.1 1-acyl-sn-glycerol-3-phosphate acyltransferase [Rhodococcus sp. FXJ9.536]
MWYWIFKFVLIGPVLRLVGRPTIVGAHHIPKSGPVILASNHLTVVDSFYLVLMVRRRITFVAKSEYFTEHGTKGRLKRWFFTAAGQVPIDRSGASAADAALDTARKILEDGKVWGIYPEGTRSPDGRLHKGKTGIARVALATGAPVLPVAMHGTPTINRHGSALLRFGKVSITVGAPLDFSRYGALCDNRHVVRAATDELMHDLMVLSGQEYVDAYAARR